MEFHQAIVELADSERLNEMFLALRWPSCALPSACSTTLSALHAPYVDTATKIVELFEAGKPQGRPPPRLTTTSALRAHRAGGPRAAHP